MDGLPEGLLFFGFELLKYAQQTLLVKKNNVYIKCYLHVNLKIHNLL